MPGWDKSLVQLRCPRVASMCSLSLARNVFLQAGQPLYRAQRALGPTMAIVSSPEESWLRLRSMKASACE